MIHVLTVRTRMRKSLQTFCALEWFFAGMQSLVFGQMMLVFECFRTILAFVWTLTCVIPEQQQRCEHKRNERENIEKSGNVSEFV